LFKIYSIYLFTPEFPPFFPLLARFLALIRAFPQLFLFLLRLRLTLFFKPLIAFSVALVILLLNFFLALFVCILIFLFYLFIILVFFKFLILLYLFFFWISSTIIFLA